MRWIGQITYDEVSYFREDVIIEADNKLGIGTFSPSEKLHVVGDALITGDSLADAFKPAAAGEPIKFKNFGGTEQARILDGGNVGIGTDSPGEKLTVEGNISASGAINGASLDINGAADVEGIITSLGFRTDTTNTNFSLISRDSSGNCPLFVQSANSSGNQQIARFSYGSATAAGGTNVLTVAKDNSYFLNVNVGIGTASPNEKLEIDGNIRLANSGKLYLWQSHDANYLQYYRWEANTGNLMYINNSGSGGFALKTAGNTRLHINNNGNVGIGTTSPDFELDVAGNIGMDGKLYHNTDHNTYIGFESDDIKLRTGGVDVITVNSSQNVGIGTTNPAAKITIIGSGENGGILFNNAGSQEHRFYSYENYQFNAIGSSDPIWNWVQFTGVGVTPTYKMTLNNTGLSITGGATLTGGLTGTTATFKGYDVGSTDNLIIQNSFGTKTFSVSNNGQVNIDGSQKLVTSDASIELRNNQTGLMSLKSAGSYGITFGDNGGESMRINTSTNNVGIGTTAPATKFEVVDNSSGGIRLSHANGEYIQMRNSGTVAYLENTTSPLFVNSGADLRLNATNSGADIYLDASGFIKFRESGVDIMAIDGGNVGIGTTSPGRNLHIEATGVAASVIGGTTGADLYFRPNHSYSANGNFGIKTTGLNSGTYESTMNITGYGNGTNNIMTIKGLGNVGIGTTAPNQKLHVVGNAKVSGVLYSSILSNDNGVSQKFRSSAAADLMTILENGNVGIGTTAPTEKLHIVGDTFIDGGLKVNAANIDFTGLGTTDPAVAGRLWNDRGILKISSGE